MNHVPAIHRSTQARKTYSSKSGVMGRLPLDYQMKSYMFFGRYEYPHGSDRNLAGFSIKMPKIKINTKKFFNSIGKAFKNIADVVQDTIKAATKVVKAIVPPAFHKYIDVVVNPVQLITNPKATIELLNPVPLVKVITNPVPNIKYMLDPMPMFKEVGNIAHDISSAVGDAATDIYREGVRPVYKASMNVAAEVAGPASVILDKTIYKVLPSHLVEKLEMITDMPVEAMRGKLTDQDVMAIAKAAVQVAMVPAAIGFTVTNGFIDILKKDGIIGPFIKDLDQYTGGLLSAVDNLAATGLQVYNNENINWKSKLIDALKIYLAYLTAGTLSAYLVSIAAQYVGDKTGLTDNAIGRDILSLGTAYYSAGNFTTDALADAGMKQVDNTMRREIIQKAMKQGIIGDADLANFIYDASTGKIENGKLIDVLQERADARFQTFVENEVQERTGLPLKYKDLVGIYDADYSEIWENVERESTKALDNAGNIVENIGNEIVRTPANVANILTNVGNEIVRTPSNVVSIVSDIGAEVVRIPSNTVNILDNIATETGVGWEKIVAEVVRTPENISNIMGNVAAEAGRTPENMIAFVGTFDPGQAVLDLVGKYGVDAVGLLFKQKGIKNPNQELTPDQYLDVIDLASRTNAPKKSSVAPVLIAGSMGLAALFFVTNED